jgi:nickel transport protein
VIDSFYSSQFVKSLFANSDASTKPVGMKLEIIPLKSPYELKAGELLPIKVFFDGRPVEGVTVEINSDKEAFKTDEDGVASVKISGKGMQCILAKKKIPSRDNPDADYYSYTTAFTFDLK